jgi:hypothetical protein
MKQSRARLPFTPTAPDMPEENNNGWRDIESAPRDGTAIDLWGLEFGAGFMLTPKPQRFCDAKYVPPSEQWNRGCWWHPNYGNVEPTHWMPAPQPPNPDARSG